MPLSQADSDNLSPYFTAMAWSDVHYTYASVKSALEGLIRELESSAKTCKVNKVEAKETEYDGDVVDLYCPTRRSYRFTKGKFEEVTEVVSKSSADPRPEGPEVKGTSSSSDEYHTTPDEGSVSKAKASDEEAQRSGAATPPPAADLEQPTTDARSTTGASSGACSVNDQGFSSGSDAWSSDGD